MKITIIGTGYVGLVSGACFAKLGLNVTCVDNNSRKIADLKDGNIPIFEHDLEELVVRNQDAGRLNFTDNLKEGIDDSVAIFIAVGTPPLGIDGGADLSYVYAVARELAPIIKDGTLIVTKSTVPVGTGDEIYSIIKEIRPELNFSVASNPEFLREGCAVKDFLKPDRVLVGVNTDSARSVMESIYRPLADKNIQILFTDIKTAELTKYAANAFLATKIAFINEIADICEKVGADIENVARGIGADHRIGNEYLKVGPGFGGSCFPKDTLALRKIAKDVHSSSKIVEAVICSNEQRKISMAQKIINAFDGEIKNKTIAVLGLAFKANTDDMRHSPSLVIIQELLKKGAEIRVYDPEAMGQAKILLQDSKITWCNDTCNAIDTANAVVIVTEWDEFKNLNLDKIKDTNSLIIDFRNLYSVEQMKRRGITYISIGR